MQVSAAGQSEGGAVNATAAWHSLVDDLYDRAMAAVARFDLHLTFVLDGDASVRPARILGEMRLPTPF